MAQKRIGSIESDVIFTGGILVGGYFLLKNVFPNLIPNLGATPEEKQIIQTQETLPNASNVFSGESQWWLNYGSENLDFKNYDTSTQLMQSLRDQYFQNNAQPLASMGFLANIVGWAESLYEDMSGFLVPNNINDAVYILNQIQNKWQVGAMSEYLTDNYGFGTDVWSLLYRGAGATLKGAGSTNLVAAINRLNSLPD